VRNLLSERIINADGSPGPNFAKAHQYKIVSAPNGAKFFSSANLGHKELYATLPAPDVGGVGPVSPLAGFFSIPGGNPGLPPADQFLFATGGTGLDFTLGPDIRITNVNSLPPGPFQMTGPTMPFDAFTSDTTHGYFQMIQQMDCAIDAEHVSRNNPTGCLHDLQSAVATTYGTPLTDTPHDTGQTMAFFNMQDGDAPFLKFLADEYTISDNYHQPVFGGTGRTARPWVLPIRCSSVMVVAIPQPRRRPTSIIPIRRLERSTFIPDKRSSSIVPTLPSPVSPQSRII